MAFVSMVSQRTNFTNQKVESEGNDLLSEYIRSFEEFESYFYGFFLQANPITLTALPSSNRLRETLFIGYMSTQIRGGHPTHLEYVTPVVAVDESTEMAKKVLEDVSNWLGDINHVQISETLGEPYEAFSLVNLFTISTFSSSYAKLFRIHTLIKLKIEGEGKKFGNSWIVENRENFKNDEWIDSVSLALCRKHLYRQPSLFNTGTVE